MAQAIVYLTDKAMKLLNILESTGAITNRSDSFLQMLYEIAEKKGIKAGLNLKLNDLREQVRELERLQASFELEIEESDVMRKKLSDGFDDRRTDYDRTHWQKQTRIDYDPSADPGVKGSVWGFLTAPEIKKSMKIAFPGMKVEQVIEVLEVEYQTSKARSMR